MMVRVWLVSIALTMKCRPLTASGNARDVVSNTVISASSAVAIADRSGAVKYAMPAHITAAKYTASELPEGRHEIR